MTEIAATEKQTPGRRLSHAEVAERVAFVRALLEARFSRAIIHEEFVDKYGQASPRTVDSYIQKVKSGWLQESEASRPDARERFLEALEHDIELYKSAKAYGPHSSARRLQARVLGLDAQQIAVDVTAHRAHGEPHTPEEQLHMLRIVLRTHPELVREALGNEIKLLETSNDVDGELATASDPTG